MFITLLKFYSKLTVAQTVGMNHLLLYSMLIICIHARPLGQKVDGDSSVSGEVKVEERTKGIVRVSELSEGDVIFGIRGPERKPAWCKVVAVFSAAGDKNRITHDGFTAGHTVINYTVHPYGEKGEVRKGPIYTLATDCDASVNAAGQAFTPISTAFCPHELSWSEYIILISAIRRVANRTGYFWFGTSANHDNDTAIVPHLFHQLHEICRELLLCVHEGRCHSFENAIKTYHVQKHLKKKYVEVVKTVSPNMGGYVERKEGGQKTEVVRPPIKQHIVPLSVVGISIGVLVLLAVAIMVCGVQVVGRNTKKEVETTCSPMKIPGNEKAWDNAA